jgi:hypothetical protein
LQNVSTDPPKELIMYRLAEKFGWTYEQIIEQPNEFIERMITIMSIENKKKNDK